MPPTQRYYVKGNKRGTFGSVCRVPCFVLPLTALQPLKKLTLRPLRIERLLFLVSLLLLCTPHMHSITLPFSVFCFCYTQTKTTITMQQQPPPPGHDPAALQEPPAAAAAAAVAAPIEDDVDEEDGPEAFIGQHGAEGFDGEVLDDLDGEGE